MHFENLSEGAHFSPIFLCCPSQSVLTLRRTAQDMAVAKLCLENATAKQVFMKTTAASAAVPATAGLSEQRMQTAGIVVFCSSVCFLFEMTDV